MQRATFALVSTDLPRLLQEGQIQFEIRGIRPKSLGLMRMTIPGPGRGDAHWRWKSLGPS